MYAHCYAHFMCCASTKLSFYLNYCLWDMMLFILVEVTSVSEHVAVAIFTLKDVVSFVYKTEAGSSFETLVSILHGITYHNPNIYTVLTSDIRCFVYLLCFKGSGKPGELEIK